MSGSLLDLYGQASTAPPDYTARNAPWTISGGPPYSTPLDPSSEAGFRQWVQQHNVPFDPAQAGPTDYDMRGFYQGIQQGNPIAVQGAKIDPNDGRMHYPDNWKTPLHETFSNESQWATPDAPRWTPDDRLVDRNGRVLFDDRASQAPRQSAALPDPLMSLIKLPGR